MGAEEHLAARGQLGDPEALTARLFRDMAGALELLTVYLGERLGLYRDLSEHGPATSAELAARTGTTERYVREWLEHHAASGLLEVDDPAAGPLERRYWLPPGPWGGWITVRTVCAIAASAALLVLPAHSAAGDSTVPAAAAVSVTIAAVGDTMLGGAPDLPPDPGTYLESAEPTLDRGAQIVFGNLEGTLTTSTASKCGPVARAIQNCFAFRDPPGYARYFKQAGFTVLNDANNHSFDFGAVGQAQTVQSIRAAGLAQTGLPGEVTVVRDHGVKVAFVAFAPYPYDADLLDLPAARSLIKRARREADLVVVYMHAGAEGPGADHVTGREEYYVGEDRGNPEAFAHMAIDAGASLVIASGPHVLRGMQFYHGHLIAYSLGNFAGYRNFATEGDLDISVILHVTLSATGRFESARIYPIQFTGQGRPVPGGGGIAFIARLGSADFGPSAARIRPSGVISAP